MNATATHRRNLSALAVVVTLAALAFSAIASTAAAAESAVEPGPSVWATDSSGETPTLTNDALQPEGGSGALLPLGFGLVGLAALGLGIGIVAGSRKGGGSPPARSDAPVSDCPPADAVAAPL